MHKGRIGTEMTPSMTDGFDWSAKCTAPGCEWRSTVHTVPTPTGVAPPALVDEIRQHEAEPGE